MTLPDLPFKHTLNCHYCNRQVEQGDHGWQHVHDQSNICIVLMRVKPLNSVSDEALR